MLRMFSTSTGEVDIPDYAQNPSVKRNREVVTNQTCEDIVKTTKEAPEYAIDVPSKAFNNAQIQLREIRYPWYTQQELRGFFSALDFVDRVYVSDAYISPDTFFTVVLGKQQHSIPVSVFWSCLPQDLRNVHKHEWTFYKIYKSLFAAYDRRLYIY